MQIAERERDRDALWRIDGQTEDEVRGDGARPGPGIRPRISAVFGAGIETHPRTQRRALTDVQDRAPDLVVLENYWTCESPCKSNASPAQIALERSYAECCWRWPIAPPEPA